MPDSAMPDNLANKPLIEAILEVKWPLFSDEFGKEKDPRSPLFAGQLYEKLKADFPWQNELPISRVPEDMTPHQPRIQFRAIQDGWPLVQLGPGILTLNQTEGYEWQSYRELCSKVLDALFNTYPTGDLPLEVEEISLRYIDADELGDESAIQFMNHLEVKIEEPVFVKEYEALDDKLLSVSLNMVYPCKTPKGALIVSYKQGLKLGAPALIWESRIVSRSKDVPQDHSNFCQWLDDAHTVTHDWFTHQIEHNLLDKYK